MATPHRTTLYRHGWFRRDDVRRPATLVQPNIHVRAFGWGVLGAMVMSSLMVLARWTGLTELTLELLLGSALTRQADTATWFGGVALHFVAGGVFALIYARIFLAWGGASAARGAAIGAVHGVLSGCLLLAVPLLHPTVPELFPAPGFLAVNYGFFTAGAFFALHVLYGAIVGAGCAPPRMQRQDLSDPRRAEDSVMGGRLPPQP